jgi:anti-sigma factor RsiW
MTKQLHHAPQPRLPARAATLAALLAIAPISLFVASAAGRLLQPVADQPATSEEWIFEWFVSLPAVWAALLLIALPLAAMLLAGGVLWQSWTSDGALRSDARLTAALLGRLARKPHVWLSAGVVLVGVLLGLMAVVHGITG